MKRFLGISLTAVLMSSTALALPLEEAVRTALQTNPDVGIVIENRRAIEYELKQSEAAYRPDVDFNAGAGHEYTDDPGSRATGDSYNSMNRYESGVTVTQMLFDGYATDSDVERQKSRVVSASRRVRETSEQIALDASQAYLESRRQRELTALAEENVRIHEETLELVTRKVEGGASTIADQQQATSRLATAEASLEDARVRLRDADATYARIIGEAPVSLQRPVAPFWAMPASIDEAIDWAIGNNPSVNVSKADLETAMREFDGAKAGFFPTVNLELGADANRNVDGTRGAEYNAEAMIRMTYNLYNGGEDTYLRQENLARIAEARQVYNRAVRLTEEEMRLAWNARDGSVSRVRAQRREVEANDVVRQTYRQQFDLGGRSLLELLDSENEYFLARTNLISTEFEAIFGVYRVLATGGVLLASLEVPKPLEADTDFDPVETRGADLEAKDAQSINIDPVLGEEVEVFEAPVLDDLDATEGDTLDPNALDGLEELDPNALELEESEVLDPTSSIQDEVVPVEARIVTSEEAAAVLSVPDVADEAPVLEKVEASESVAAPTVEIDASESEALISVEDIAFDDVATAQEVEASVVKGEPAKAELWIEPETAPLSEVNQEIPVVDYAAFDDAGLPEQSNDLGKKLFENEESAF